MQLAYRDIANVVDHKIHLSLPNYINTEKVEVIIIPYTTPKLSKPKVDFQRYFGASNIGTEKIDKYLEDARNDWERTILD